MIYKQWSKQRIFQIDLFFSASHSPFSRGFANLRESEDAEGLKLDFNGIYPEISIDFIGWVDGCIVYTQ
jgi:hypothetical protein